jgi:glucokinase
MQKAAIGFDLGGSHFSAAAVANGKLLTMVYTAKIDPKWKQDHILSIMSGVIKQLIDLCKNSDYEFVGAGGGVPGPANFETGVIVETPNMATMRGCRLTEKLGCLIGMPVKINNDANLMVYGESSAGAGVGHRIVYGCTLGTGFGHGLVIDGKIYTGANFMAMELAKAPIELPPADRSGDTIENQVSTRGIKLFYAERSGKRDLNYFDPKEIEELANRGDKTAIATYEYFGRCLGFALSWIQGTIAPDIILVGGNLAKAWPLFSPEMLRVLKDHSWNKEPSVKLMSLGQNAGIIGGASLFND